MWKISYACELGHEKGPLIYTLTCGMIIYAIQTYAMGRNLTHIIIVCINKTPGPAEISLHGIYSYKINAP